MKNWNLCCKMFTFWVESFCFVIFYQWHLSILFLYTWLYIRNSCAKDDFQYKIQNILELTFLDTNLQIPSIKESCHINYMLYMFIHSIFMWTIVIFHYFYIRSRLTDFKQKTVNYKELCALAVRNHNITKKILTWFYEEIIKY